MRSQSTPSTEQKRCYLELDRLRQLDVKQAVLLGARCWKHISQGYATTCTTSRILHVHAATLLHFPNKQNKTHMYGYDDQCIKMRKRSNKDNTLTSSAGHDKQLFNATKTHGCTIDVRSKIQFNGVCTAHKHTHRLGQDCTLC